MYIRISTAALALIVASGAASAQTANPVAQAFRDEAASSAKNLTAAAEEFPAAKYGYKPTKPQMSFGDIVVHLTEGNDYLCGKIGGVTAPTRAKIAATVAGIDAATEVSVTTNIPAASLVPAFMVRNTTASARELAADYYDIRITGLSR